MHTFQSFIFNATIVLAATRVIQPILFVTDVSAYVFVLSYIYFYSISGTYNCLFSFTDEKDLFINIHNILLHNDTVKMTHHHLAMTGWHIGHRCFETYNQKHHSHEAPPRNKQRKYGDVFFFQSTYFLRKKLDVNN